MEPFTSKKLHRGKLAGIALRSFIRERFSRGAGKRYFTEQLLQIPGVPAKVAQFIDQRNEVSNSFDAPQAVPIEYVRSILEESCPEVFFKIGSISSSPLLASLGQVHRAILKDGSELAIKVQYPGVAEDFKSSLMSLLTGLEKISPTRGRSLADFKEFLRDQFVFELDYEREASNQNRFFLATMGTQFKVPRVNLKATTDLVLVQEWVNSTPFAEYGSSVNEEKRKQVAYSFASSWLELLAGEGWIHTDLQPANTGIDPDTLQIVLYDFGSCLNLDENTLRPLRYLALKVMERRYSLTSSEAAELLGQVGFDLGLLTQIEDRLHQILFLMFDPFLSQGEYRFEKWDIGRRLDDLVGAEKWSFRMAGPPWFLFLMRSFFGLAQNLKSLNVGVPMHLIFQLALNKFAYPQAPSTGFSSVTNPSQVPQIDTAPNALRVRVLDDGQEKVSLELPVRSVDWIEELVSDDVLELIKNRKIDLEKIKAEARNSAYAQQVLFELEDGQRIYKVWIG